jgi:hypothetical protein
MKEIGNKKSRTDEHDKVYHLDCITEKDQNGHTRYIKISHAFKVKLIMEDMKGGERNV